MKRTDMNRRDFARLTAAAFGGVVAGSMGGCGKPAADAPATAGNSGDAASANGAEEESTDVPATDGELAALSLMLVEPHVCRGLNTCMNKGASGENACAGQGTCATATHHTCATQNECKGQGGCGGEHGTNACKGMGGCGVPLEHGWEDVRAKFEKAMSASGKELGPAPDAG